MTQRIVTRFACKICGDTMEFNAEDPSTYLGKSVNVTFFGMELNSYRVSHQMGNEIHYNSVIADQKSLFRGYLDAYAEVENKSEYIISEVGITSEKIKYLFVVNMTSNLVWNFIPSPSLNSIIFIEKSIEKVKEISELYNDRSDFRFSVADLDVDCILSDDKVLLIVPHKSSDELIGTLKSVLNHHVGNVVDNLISSITLLVKIFDATPAMNKQKVASLVINPYIHTTLEIQYPEYIPAIISRLSREFELPESIFKTILSNDQTLYSIVEENPSYYLDILEIIEFINRRKLLGGRF